MQQSLFVFSLLAISAVAACLLILQPFPVLHDYPEWMYQGWLLGQLFSGNADVAASYALVSYPVPNALSQAAIGLLSMVVSPVVAGKVWLGVYLVCALTLCIVLWRRFDDGVQVLLLTAIVIFGPGFWNGYINFQFALLLFAGYLFATGGIVKNGPGRLLLFSLLIFFAHAAVFAVFVIYCLANVLFTDHGTGKPRARALVALVPSLILLSWYALIVLAHHQAVDGAAMSFSKWAQYKVYTLAKQGPFHNFILHSGESLLEQADWLYKLGLVVNFGASLLLMCWFFWLLWRWWVARSYPLRTASWVSFPVVTICVGFCLLVYLVAGANSFGVVNLGERFLIVALMMVLLLMQCPKLLQGTLGGLAAVGMLYVILAVFTISNQALEAYSVERSSASTDLTNYVDEIYANTRHEYFNHRLFIYADRGLSLMGQSRDLLEIDLETSMVRRIQ